MATPRSPEEIRNVERLRALLESVDRGEAGISEYYDPAFRDHGDSPTRTDAPMSSVFAELRVAFPEVRHEILHLVTEGDLVAARISARGVQRGEYRGLRAANREIELVSTVLYRFRDGLIVERWCDHCPSITAALEPRTANE